MNTTVRFTAQNSFDIFVIMFESFFQLKKPLFTTNLHEMCFCTLLRMTQVGSISVQLVLCLNIFKAFEDMHKLRWLAVSYFRKRKHSTLPSHQGLIWNFFHCYKKPFLLTDLQNSSIFLFPSVMGKMKHFPA